MMEITYKNTFGDILAFMKYHYIRLSTVQIMTLLFLGLTSWTTLQILPRGARISVKIITFLISESILLFIVVLLSAAFLVLGMVSKANRTLLTEHRVALDKAGIIEETQFNRSEYKWSGIHKVSRSKKHLFIYVSQHMAHVIPKRAFESNTEWDKFYITLKDHIKK